MPELHISPAPVGLVDATPDADYPLRILRAHRHNCGSLVSIDSLGGQNEVSFAMNQLQRQRAAVLDVALAILASHAAELASVAKAATEAAPDA